MYATNFFEDKIVKLLRQARINGLPKVYIGLFLNNPNEEGAGVELSYTGYTRQEIVFAAPRTDSSGTYITNSNDIAFKESPINVGNATYIGIFDSIVGGNMYLYGQLTVPINVQIGVSPIVRVNGVKFIMSGNVTIEYKTRILNIFRGTDCLSFFVYLGLLNGNPESGGNEFNGTGYQRTQVIIGQPELLPDGKTQVSNINPVITPEASDNWGTLTHIGIYDAETGGNAFMYIPLGNSYNMITGTVCQFLAGKLKFSVN